MVCQAVYYTDLLIYQSMSLPMAKHSADVPSRLQCSASKAHNIQRKLNAEERQLTMASFQNRGLSFSFEGKHYNVCDNDSHSSEGHIPERLGCVVSGPAQN